MHGDRPTPQPTWTWWLTARQSRRRQGRRNCQRHTSSRGRGGTHSAASSIASCPVEYAGAKRLDGVLDSATDRSIDTTARYEYRRDGKGSFCQRRQHRLTWLAIVGRMNITLAGRRRCLDRRPAGCCMTLRYSEARLPLLADANHDFETARVLDRLIAGQTRVRLIEQEAFVMLPSDADEGQQAAAAGNLRDPTRRSTPYSQDSEA
jgi:hypothetical protein